MNVSMHWETDKQNQLTGWKFLLYWRNYSLNIEGISPAWGQMRQLIALCLPGVIMTAFSTVMTRDN